MLLTYSSYKRPKKSGSGGGGYTMLNNQLNDLEQIYSDPISGDVKDVKYYDDSIAAIQNVLMSGGLTKNQIGDLQLQLKKLQSGKKVFQAFTSGGDLMTQTDKAYDADKKATWQQLWTQLDMFKQPNSISALANGMLANSENVEDGINQSLKQLEEAGATKNDTYNALQSLKNKVNDDKVYWQGVLLKPEEYAVTIGTNNSGEVANFNIVKDIPASHKKVEGVDIGGLPIYMSANPFMSKNGQDYVNLGGNIFIDSGSKSYIFDKNESRRDNPDLSGLKRQEKYYPGTVLRSPDNKVYVMSENSELFSFKDEQSAKDNGIYTDNALDLTDDDAKNLGTLYRVKDAVAVKKQEDIQTKIEAAAQSYKETPTSQFVLEGLESTPVLGMGVKAFGETTEQLSRTFKPAAKEVGGTIEGLGGAFGKAAGDVGNLITPLFKDTARAIKTGWKSLFGKVKY